MGDLTVHELIWGYAGAIGVLFGFIVYGLKKEWPQRISAKVHVFLVTVGLVKKPLDPINAHMRVKRMLIELRVETRADRAHVVQFHNGDYYDNNSSIKRFTYCYEDLKNGVSSIAEKYQRRLVSGYIEGLEKLVDENNVVNKLSYADLESCLYKGKMLEDGVHTQIGIPLRSKFNGIPRIIGYILLSYNSDRDNQRCAFDALVEEGHFINTDTDRIENRECNGSCPDCRFQRYIPQFEESLRAIK